MMVRYQTLAGLRMTHAYHAGLARHLEPVIPAETARVLGRARGLCKMVGDTLQFIYEASEGGAPLVQLPGARLRVGVRVVDAAFENVTDAASLPASGIAHWRNATSAAALDPFVATRLVGAVFEHPLGDAARPVTVTVEGDDGVVWSEVVSAAQGRSSVSIDLGGVEPNAFTVREAYPTSTLGTAIFLHPELAREHLIGIVDLQIDSSFYTTPPTFSIALDAREETLRYYVVVDNYTPAELATLDIADAGAAEDGRPAILFDRVSPPFASDELPTSQLGGSATSDYVLFRSRDVVTRQERARRKIELHRNGDLLIPHLPQPRPDQSDANIVIHIGK